MHPIDALGRPIGFAILSALAVRFGAALLLGWLRQRQEDRRSSEHRRALATLRSIFETPPDVAPPR